MKKKNKNPIIIPNQDNYQDMIWGANTLEYSRQEALEQKLRFKHAKMKK